MTDYVLYRLPHAQQAYRIDSKVARLLSSPTELDDVSGFVMAPFVVSQQTPIVALEGNPVAMELQPLNRHGKVVETSRRADYTRDFRCFHDALCRGQFAKLVLSRSAELSSQDDFRADELFAEACRRYPRMMIALVSTHEAGTWLMATPEILLAYDADHRWHTMALAGTMQWQGDRDYEWSQKNIREQQMVAQYIEQTLTPLASDIVTTSPYTVRAGNLVHLRSDFSFSLRDESKGIGRVVEALHPTPAVCGLPKPEALDFILSHESINRRYYSGYCGPWRIATTTALFVSLRCMEIVDNRATMYAGGGLLAESNEESEWQETMMKMEAMRRLINQDLCTQTR